MAAFGHLGMRVDEGWDAIGARLKTAMERLPQTYDTATRLRWGNLNIVADGNMAWASYDMVGIETGDDFEMAGLTHELKVFQRIDGAWKIGWRARCRSARTTRQFRYSAGYCSKTADVPTK